MKSRILAELHAMGPRPPWYRWIARRRWTRTSRGLIALWVALEFEEAVKKIAEGMRVARERGEAQETTVN